MWHLSIFVITDVQALKHLFDSELMRNYKRIRRIVEIVVGIGHS